MQKAAGGLRRLLRDKQNPIYEAVAFDVLHVVEWTPEGVPEPAALCNVEHAQEVLGLTFRGNLARFQPARL